jgi:NADPH:quinone reductase-like Zn-dependent oxidoreductase
MMRAVVISHPGDSDVVLRDVPCRAGPGAIRVRVRAFGISRADLLQRARPSYPPPADAPSDIPGRLGSRARWMVGRRSAAMGGPRPGDGHRRRRARTPVRGVVPASHAVRVPEGLTDVSQRDPQAFVTAHDALRRATSEPATGCSCTPWGAALESRRCSWPWRWAPR